LLSLYPFGTSVAASVGPAPVDRYAAMFPARTEEQQRQRWTAQDAHDDALEAARDAERDQVAASAALTDAEYRSIFGN
jgi:hypothetical protein